MTVLDTSGAIDYLLGWAAAPEVERLLLAEGELAAPDILVFETVSALWRQALGGGLDANRAEAALVDLGDLPLRLYPSLPLRLRAWELRSNLTAADGLFVALAERLDEPLATKDLALASAVGALDGVGIPVVSL
ncbi:MAG TPA: type II toxin-antitoxin system VapC family toxin [Solirubrobacteraceae bacterium]|nr:type II toxin-antitoxin system VapC family toxin [Solirubrobacteraceae bacterium]